MNVAVVIATAVNVDGHREVLGLDVITTEDGAGWLAFLRSLVARGLSGVQLVISDAHQGLKSAIEATLPGASWQRCRTHAARNLLTKVPKSSQGMVGTLVRTIFEQPDAEQVKAQHARVVEQLAPRFCDVATMLTDMAPDLLAFTSFPTEHWSAIRSNNPQERLNKELRRRDRRGGDLSQSLSGGATRRARCSLNSTTSGPWLAATCQRTASLVPEYRNSTAKERRW